MNFKKEYEGEAKAIITDAFIFTDFKPGELPDMKFFTRVAAWDTGAEHTSLSMEVIEALQLQPVGYDTIAVFGGVKEAGLYQVSIGLPNATILHNMIVYGADLDEYSMLIGMDIIRRTDFLITNKDTARPPSSSAHPARAAWNCKTKRKLIIPHDVPNETRVKQY